MFSRQDDPMAMLKVTSKGIRRAEGVDVSIRIPWYIYYAKYGTLYDDRGAVF